MFWRVLRAACLVAIIACLSGSVANAATITVGWNRNSETDVTGYKLSWGAASRQYSTTIDVGNAISYVFNGADPTRRYYFAVQAYNVNGLLSAYSTEVSWPPSRNPADLDSDGKADLTVYRPSSGTWFNLRSNTNYTQF